MRVFIFVILTLAVAVASSRTVEEIFRQEQDLRVWLEKKQQQEMQRRAAGREQRQRREEYRRSKKWARENYVRPVKESREHLRLAHEEYLLILEEEKFRRQVHFAEEQRLKRERIEEYLLPLKQKAYQLE